MNRRSFLRFCGIIPVLPALAVEALEQPKLGACTLMENIIPPYGVGNWIEPFSITSVVWHEINAEQLSNIKEAVKEINPPSVISTSGQWRIFKDECHSRNIPIPKPRTTATNT